MQNAVALGVAQRVECIHSDMFTNILRNESVVYDVIVSNPPYIPTDDLDGLQREVRDYDPAAALDGGKDGLDFYRVLFGDAKRYLTPNGIILVEFGIGQSVDITDIASAAGWHDISVYQDLSGIERVLQANL
jgi:release factor glutamine methyltransferase